MSTSPSILLGMLLCLGSAAAFAEHAPTTALGAIKLLPKGCAPRVALVEAREGKPIPERWHILVHDPKEENGLHEYVVAGGEIVASRSLSQFAESISKDDVFGESVKVDSDRAAKLAQKYAEANGKSPTEMNFELRKGGDAAAPTWNVTCLDAAGNDLGHLVLTATKGTVVSHEGFDAEPPSSDKIDKAEKTDKSDKPEKPKAEKPEKPERSDKPEKTEIAEKSDPARPQQPDATDTVFHAEPVAEKKPEPRHIEVKRAEAVRPQDEEKKPGLFQRAGGAIGNLFNHPKATPVPSQPFNAVPAR